MRRPSPDTDATSTLPVPLQLAAMSIAAAGGPGAWPDPVERPARRPGPVGRRGGRRARRGAAATYGLLTAPHATAEADRALLRRCALALLAHPADVDLHGAALTLLVRDPQTRDPYLPKALRVFVQGDPHLSAAELVVALPTRREPVIAAFREALTRPGTVRARCCAHSPRSTPRRRHCTRPVRCGHTSTAIRKVARMSPSTSTAGWSTDAPQEWAAVVGPGARRSVETLSTAMTMPMQAPGRGHGSLRPA